ncbi:hypothetical protein EIP86_006943 [Pleurotus ostreatoroseus]|nr:hypothetical protein EIP86_006943 [Pleurotus ostreatoroseus]
MALATAELCCTVPVAAYGLWINISLSQIQPWISWSDTHFNYSQVDQFPAILWRMDRHTVIGMEMTRAAPVVCALVFFAFFGFADEAYRHYRKAYHAIVQIFHIPAFSFKWRRSQRQRAILPTDSNVAGVLPVFQTLPSTAKSSPTTSNIELKTGRSDSFVELPY